MRVLFIATPGVGHVFPMIPLAWALRADGHEVLVATTSDGMVAVRAGLPVVDVKPGFDRRAMFEKMKREQPDYVREALRRRIDDVHAVAERFAMMSTLIVDGVLAAAEGFRPDLIIQSQVQGSGLVAAGRLGVPVIDHGFGFARSGGMAELHFRNMAETFERFGVTELPRRRSAIDVAPPSMVDEPLGWPMRYVPYNGGAVLPAWLGEPVDRPRIAVTLGTIAGETLGLDPVHRLVELADGFDAEFVLALGDTDLTALGPLPANVRPAGWVPLNELLPTCRAIVHHGGAGTTLTALATGTPQLVLPTGADRHINAAAVRNRNAGLEATTEDLTGELIGRLLNDESIATAAAEVRAEIAAQPSPADLVRTLVDFATAEPVNLG